jgi:hypothetical protein
MSEAALWGYLRDRILPKEGHYSRIESETSPGFPDVTYTLRGVSGTLELKFARHTLPFGDEGLRRDQIIWISDEVAAGGYVWIVAEFRDKIYFVSGMWAERFNKFVLSDLETHAKLIFPKGLREAKKDRYLLLVDNLLVKKA